MAISTKSTQRIHTRGKHRRLVLAGASLIVAGGPVVAGLVASSGISSAKGNDDAKEKKESECESGDKRTKDLRARKANTKRSTTTGTKEIEDHDCASTTTVVGGAPAPSSTVPTTQATTAPTSAPTTQPTSTTTASTTTTAAPTTTTTTKAPTTTTTTTKAPTTTTTTAAPTTTTKAPTTTTTTTTTTAPTTTTTLPPPPAAVLGISEAFKASTSGAGMRLEITVSNTGNKDAVVPITLAFNMASTAGAKMPGFVGQNNGDKVAAYLCSPDYFNDAHNMSAFTFNCTLTIPKGTSMLIPIISGSPILANAIGGTISATFTADPNGPLKKVASASVLIVK